MATPLRQAQEFLVASDAMDAWLVYDYQGMNPAFADLVGATGFLTRPVFLLVPPAGRPVLLHAGVDGGRIDVPEVDARRYVGLDDCHRQLRALLRPYRRLAMEYSPMRRLPRASRVDAGTVELVRSFGIEVVSSAELLQYATQRWTAAGLASHRRAAEAIHRIVIEAFGRIGERLASGVTEHDIAEFIRSRFGEEGLWTDHGPVVAANGHASEPHFEPSPEHGARFERGDWVLIDLWARDPGPDGIFADITWVGYVGDKVPAAHQRIFDLVAGARDIAAEFLRERIASGRNAQGWEVDKVARDHIARSGHGDRFFHRLGHSLGRQVHAGGVNLDSTETHDERTFLHGLGFTIEPGVYLPEFGVRSEIDLHIGPAGLEITTPVQREVVRIAG
ncbi:MAG: aminopeptidase P family protein [SAR202 cluster bacterium]|nr:aminopeptidase P family protein [SAR202 cluster bacterium]